MSGAAHAVALVPAAGSGSALWRAALEGLARRDVYWRPEYAALYAGSETGEAAAFVTHGAGLGTVVHPVLVRDITALPWASGLRVHGSPWRDLATPYGYGGPLGSEEEPAARAAQLAAFEEARGALCLELGIVSEFVRFHPLLCTHEGLPEAMRLQRRGETIWLELPAPGAGDAEEALLRAMQPAARNKIRRARAAGAAAAVEPGTEAAGVLHALYRETMTALDAPADYFFPRSYFETIAALPEERAFVVIVRHEGRAVWAGIFLREGELLHYHLSGSGGGPRVTGANNLALLAAALEGRARGARRFHLGGGFGSREDSLFQFKASVGDRRAEFWTGARIHDPGRYDALRALRSGAAGAAPAGTGDYFPAYRAP